MLSGYFYFSFNSLVFCLQSKEKIIETNPAYFQALAKAFLSFIFHV